jgi:phosphotransferase system HPr-like phosphotransfer protein
MQTFETPGSVSLQIKLPSGRVVVTTVDEPKTTVEVVARGRRGQDAIDEIDVTMRESAGRHELRIEQKDKFRWGPIQITWGGDFECRVMCPPGADLEFGGGSTDLRVEGELGEVAVSTASGDVRLQSTRGDLQVKTASGDVSVATVAGEASLVTVSGDVDVTRVGGSLTVRAVSGDVTIGAIDSESGVSTTSGDIEIRAVRDGDVRVNSVSGDVRLGVARGTRVWIDAASVSGKLESELGLEDHELGADVDAAVVPLHVKTVSGDVSIVRAAEALAT